MLAPRLHRCPGCRTWTPRTQWVGDGAAGAIELHYALPVLLPVGWTSPRSTASSTPAQPGRALHAFRRRFWSVVAEHIKNHVVSRAYLDRWADEEGYLHVEIRRAGASLRRRPGSVGYRKKFWSDDEATRVAVEQFLSSNFETGDAFRILRSLPEIWPVDADNEQWSQLLLFVALHLVRTPYWRREGRSMQERSLQDRLPDWQQRMPAAAVAAVLDRVRSNEFHSDLMLRQVSKTASVLGCMHCVLLTSGSAAFLTGDHPVVAVPLLARGERAPVRPVPERGLRSTIEFRFPIGPRHALLFSWHDEPIHPQMVPLPFAAVCDLNLSVASQAEHEIYHHLADAPPLVCPPFMPGPCAPIAPQLFSGYGPEAARNSIRRRHADAMIRELIENEIADEVRILRVTSS